MSANEPLDVYLDTDVLVNYIFGGLPDSDACAKAIQQLADSESIAYTSIITRMEFAQAVRALATRKQLPRHIYQDFDLDHWTNPHVRRSWLLHWLAEFDDFLSAMPTVAELPLTSEIINAGVELMARHGLRSHDAVHVATVNQHGIRAFWTCDGHFNRINGIDVRILRN